MYGACAVYAMVAREVLQLGHLWFFIRYKSDENKGTKSQQRQNFRLGPLPFLRSSWVRVRGRGSSTCYLLGGIEFLRSSSRPASGTGTVASF